MNDLVASLLCLLFLAPAAVVLVVIVAGRLRHLSRLTPCAACGRAGSKS